VTHRDDADDLEGDQRLAQGGAADPEACGQLPLGRQPVTRDQPVLGVPGGDLLGDLLVETGPLQRHDGIDHDVSVLTVGSMTYWLGH